MDHVTQAKKLDGMLQERSMKIDHVLNFQVPDELLVRSTVRQTHVICHVICLVNFSDANLGFRTREAGRHAARAECED